LLGFFGDKVSTVVDTLLMNHKSPQAILQEISQIQSMERGKLSVIRDTPAGPFYKLQAREKGKNRTRYVPRDQAGAVQEAIDGFQRFESLTEQYAQQVIEKTRQALAAGSKKKPVQPRLSSPKTKKSSA
jgi:hypothetical protein